MPGVRQRVRDTRHKKPVWGFRPSVSAQRSLVGLAVLGEDGLRLRHQAVPVSRDDAGRVRWCNAFCAILEGLYSRWLQSQGGSAHVILQRERVFSVSDVQFLYYHP